MYFYHDILTLVMVTAKSEITELLLQFILTSVTNMYLYLIFGIVSNPIFNCSSNSVETVSII